ncbi:MAG: tetratricopeptide repeat protein [Terracidiphilus sp.]
MGRIVVTVILILLTSTIAGAQTAESGTQAGNEAAQAPVTMETARALAGSGRLDAAMQQLNQLAAQTPEPAGVERLRGIIFYQREQFTEAIDAFTKAAAQDPNDRESMEMHGVSLFRLGRIPQAIPYLEQAQAKVQSANIDPDYVLALCYADVQRYDDSRHAFARPFGFAPDSAAAHLLAGRMFLRRELRDPAGAEAQKALQLEPGIPLAHELLGEVALSQGDVPTAVKELEAERKINPLNPDLYSRLGDAYLRAGQYDNAQQTLNRAVLLMPYATEPFILLGETFLKLQDPIQALHYLDHAERMDPSNYITHNLLGQAYKAVGQKDAANREFRRVVELQHQNDPQPAVK